MVVIGDGAFEKCMSLRRVSLPDRVKVVGFRAFADCTQLEGLCVLPRLTRLGSCAFRGCKKLTNLGPHFGENLTVILPSTFRGCEALKSFAVPRLVSGIGMRAFEGCVMLTQVALPHGLVSIGACAFRGCRSLCSIELPATLDSIGRGAFEDCTSLTSIEFPDLYVLGPRAFANCTRLRVIGSFEVTATGSRVHRSHALPQRITNIPECLFEGCRTLEKVVLGPEVVMPCVNGAFAGCTRLTLQCTINLDSAMRQAYWARTETL